MHTSRTPKAPIFLLVLLLIISLINVYPVKSDAVESNQTEVTSTKETVECIDKEIIYPEVPQPSMSEKDSSEANGIYMKHVIHMPKFNDTARINPPYIPQDMIQENETKNNDEEEINLFLPLDETVVSSTYNNTLIFESKLGSESAKNGELNDKFPIRNKAGYYSAGFSSQTGGENLLRFSYNDAELLLKPLTPLSVTGKVYDNNILFEEIYPFTDLRYSVEDYRLKEDIIIKKLTDQNEFSFHLTVSNATYQETTDGFIRFFDPTGKQIFFMAKPYAIDNNGERCDSISMQLTSEGILKLTIDPLWLKKAAYPVTVDPTIYLAGDEVYRAYTGFSSTQGLNNWYYEEQRADGNFYPMTWSSSNSRWIGSNNTIFVTSYTQHPGDNNSVRTWQAPYTGVVSVGGRVSRAEPPGGDGVNVKIIVNNTQVWPASDWQNLPSGLAGSGFNVNLSLTVNAGDYIRFVINKNGYDSRDLTVWDQYVSYYSVYGAGTEPYWNYTSTGLGGGWKASINTYSLDLSVKKTLFSIPGRGLSIGEGATYNSLDPRDGPLGIGWHLGSSTGISERPAGVVDYFAGDGSQYIFIPRPNGGNIPCSYISPFGIYLTLEEDAQGNFKLTDKKQNQYIYENGRPKQYIDRDGNTTNFTYDANNRLYQLSDPSGRAITYTYNADGKVEDITDPANRHYQFSYQNGRLVTVTDPENGTYTFSYDANGNMIGFTDSLNRTTTFSCSADGKIQYYRDARTSGQDIYETSFSQSTQNNDLVTTVTDPGSRTYSYFHNPFTANLNKYTDQLNNSWVYVWSSNNLTSIQDAKGTTTYEYDLKGNITKETITVDSNPSNNIVKTMTYDQYNDLLQVTDGGGRITSYKYNNKGNLLSTTNPNIKESNGRKYDQYGNVVEYSPPVSATCSLLRNGNMETPGNNENNLLAYWNRYSYGSIASAALEGFQSHGRSALKISSSVNTPWEMFYQNCDGITPGDKLTLRADVKLQNVTNNGGTGGALIKLQYDSGYSESWYVWGSGTVPLTISSQVPDSTTSVTVYVGFQNTSGTAWFDGVQLENTFASESYSLSAFNSVENSGFERGAENWCYNNFPFGATGPWAWDGSYSAEMAPTSNGVHSFFQVVPVYGGELLTLSGMVRTTSISGNGAYYKVEFRDNYDQVIPNATVETGYVTGTQDWTRLSTIASAPANAYRARLYAVLDGSGRVNYDTVKLMTRNSNKYIYNDAGNYILTSEDPLGKQNGNTYNESIGTVSTHTDAANNTTSYSYDNLGRLIQVTDPLSQNAYYEYDMVSNLTKSRDPRSSGSQDDTYRTGIIPNSINQLNTLTDPLNRSTNNNYDRSGNPTRISLPNGLEINYTYDNANRLTRKTLDGGRYFDYTYDGANDLTGVVDQNNRTYAWDYDGAHRIKNTIDTFNYRLDYQWDKSGNLTRLTGTGAGNVSYQYGSDNRFLSLTLPNASNLSYHYDESGRVFQIRYPGSYNYRNTGYLPNGWCSTIQDSAFPNRVKYYYEYYDNGNIRAISSWAGAEYFEYDANGRLTKWRYNSNPDINYQYDAAGNLVTKGSDTFTYNNANQITNAGFSYDTNGNLTGDGTYTYAYDAENRLTEVRRASDNSLAAVYSYNHDGSRRSKTVYSGQTSQTTNFHWDAFGYLIRESDSGGTTLANYYYDANGKIVGLKKNNQTYLYHDNLRGDIVSVTDTNNNIQAQYNYDPWGTPTSYSGTLSQPFRYAGYYYDEETGLYYCKSRYYSPTLGRFLTKDAISYIKFKNPQTLNLYTYANNNPVCKVDPDGNYVVVIPAAAAAGEALGLAGLGAAAAAATVELAKDAKSTWDRYWAEEQTFKDKIKDFSENPDNWEKTEDSEVESTNIRNRGGTSLEEEFTNKLTGEKLWRHTLKNRYGKPIEEPHFRKYPKQLK